ncbi:hypothetical protein CDAR_114601 [Caerostris darwini]|uniref:Uncharacterized protein n=1 Tax=Caerostris darwini TaxID=1538125 RepID=A0AAV4R2Y7_9ARAC|nr:hypothetical protein CDAR_114601 [Caerostris darwini]
MSLNPNQRVIHRRLSRDYSDSSDDSDDNSQKQAPPKKGPGPVTGGAGQATGGKVPEKNGLVLKPSLSLEPYDVAFKKQQLKKKEIADCIELLKDCF